MYKGNFNISPETTPPIKLPNKIAIENLQHRDENVELQQSSIQQNEKFTVDSILKTPLQLINKNSNNRLNLLLVNKVV